MQKILSKCKTSNTDGEIGTEGRLRLGEIEMHKQMQELKRKLFHKH